MNAIQKIALDAGYESSDNRSLDWRNINKAIGNDLKIEISPKGKIIHSTIRELRI